MNTKENHIVTLVALSKKHKIKPFYVVLPKSRTTNRHIDVMAGKENKFDKENPPSLKSIANEDNQIALLNNRRLNITTDAKGKYVFPEDALFYLLLQNLGVEVATDKTKIKGKNTVFYVQDLNKENTIEVTSQRQGILLGAKVMDLTDERMRELVTYLGKNPANLTAISREKACLDACTKTPKRVVEFFDDAMNETVNMQIIVSRCYHNKIISKRGAEYCFGKIEMGRSIEAVASFLSKREQNTLLQRMVTELND